MNAFESMIPFKPYSYLRKKKGEDDYTIYTSIHIPAGNRVIEPPTFKEIGCSIKRLTINIVIDTSIEEPILYPYYKEIGKRHFGKRGPCIEVHVIYETLPGQGSTMIAIDDADEA